MDASKILYTFSNNKTREVIFQDVNHESVLSLLENSDGQKYIQKGVTFVVADEHNKKRKYVVDELFIYVYAIPLFTANRHEYNCHAIVYLTELK